MEFAPGQGSRRQGIDRFDRADPRTDAFGEIKAQVEPFLPGIVDAINRAFSMATASTFTLGIVSAAVAAGFVLLLKEAPAEASVPVTSQRAGAPTADPTGS